MRNRDFSATLYETSFEQAVPPAGTGASSEVAVIHALTHMARQKWFIARWTAIAILAGIVTSLLQPVRFTSTTKIMTPQQTSSTAALLINQLASARPEAISAMSGGALSLKDPNELYIGLLTSRNVADGMIREFDLVKVYRVRDMTAARKTLAANTRILSEKSGLISISVTDRDKTRAAALANAYTAELRSLTQTLAVTEAAQRRSFYEEQLKIAKDNLVAAEIVYQQVAQKRGLVQLDTQAKAMIEGLASLQAKAAAKEVELQALRSYSTEQNPSVQLAESELASLEAETSRMQALGQNSQPGTLGLQDVARAGPEFIAAEHELQYRQILFDLLLKQYDAARLDESKSAAIIQVVETAIPPDIRSSPYRTLIVFLFAALAWMAACCWALATAFVNCHPELSQSLAELRHALTTRKG